jgi:hypothetical protein
MAFFHRIAQKRRVSKKISRIVKDDNDVVEGHDQVCKEDEILFKKDGRNLL